MPTQIRNDLFDRKVGLDRGRSFWVEALWQVCKNLIFLTSWPWPSRWKCFLLRLFGAKIGVGVVIKPRVNINFPWKLSIGDHSWIGEEASLLTFEPISIGRHCCISQRAFLCTGSHDFRSGSMAYRNSPISIEDGVWVAAQTFVAPGVTIKEDAVVTAGSVVIASMPASMICSGNPCIPLKPRWPKTFLHRDAPCNSPDAPASSM